jgi:PTS system mannose-specific IIA component
MKTATIYNGTFYPESEQEPGKKKLRTRAGGVLERDREGGMGLQARASCAWPGSQTVKEAQGKEAQMTKNSGQNAAVGIVIVAHADYAAALLRTAECILGPLADCTSISVDAAFAASETVQRLNDATQLLDKGAGVLILTDMFGGTPTNLSLALLNTHHVDVVTGVNLPMVLKAFSSRGLPLKELAEAVGEEGRNGIVVAGEMLEHTPPRTE